MCEASPFPFSSAPGHNMNMIPMIRASVMWYLSLQTQSSGAIGSFIETSKTVSQCVVEYYFN